MASDAEAMVTGNIASALITPSVWNMAQTSFAPESKEQHLSPGQLKGDRGDGCFCFASHYPDDSYFEEATGDIDRWVQEKVEVDG